MTSPRLLVALAVAAGTLATYGLVHLRHAPRPKSGVAAVAAAPARRDSLAARSAVPTATAVDDAGRRDGGYTFTSALTLADMRARLDAAGPFAWSERDSHWYGDYVGTQTLQERAVLKIVVAPGGGFGLDVKLRTDAASVDAQWAWLEETITSKLLPTVQAREIRRSGPVD